MSAKPQMRLESQVARRPPNRGNSRYPSLEGYYHGEDGSVQEITNKKEGNPLELRRSVTRLLGSADRSESPRHFRRLGYVSAPSVA